MNRLRQIFDAAGTRRPGLLPYLTAGYPDASTTIAILRGMDPTCCLCAEIGIPFSDPIADGPVIQASFSRVLASGFKLDAFLAALREQRDQIAVPLLAMVSYSIVYRRGTRAFVQAARAAGFDGLIVPDLALEEADELAELGRAADCPLVMMVAPTSDERRQHRIAALSEPFIYCQSVAGVTGERAGLPADLAERVRRLRAASGKPVCVGFGIASAEQVAAVCAVADGAIVGSALVRRITEGIERGNTPAQIIGEVGAALTQLAAGCPGCSGGGAGLNYS
jgi:tryptophan synthase alpha chain